MTTTLTFSNRHLQGEYKSTAIDAAKSKSNLLESICGKYYTITMADGTRVDLVGKRAFDKWAKNNEYMTNF